MTKITGFQTFDVRFPTSRTLAGSDAMNAAPDYSAAYVVIRTDAPDPAVSGTASRSPSAAATTCSWPPGRCGGCSPS